ncbi:oxepin-CoA hydrolase, alternative type [Aquabacterium sp.]|uniref:oxepin-CoA hydrolase, alternative type n=1 Tax=Aquabacterium sp. TaxID=1872578 RepID=UPI0035B0CC5D
MTAELQAERRDATLILTISNPAQRNTLSPQVFDAGIEALNVAESDSTLRCVILTGADRQFCAGGDLRRLAANRHATADTGLAEQTRAVERFHDWIEALHTFQKPVIAAVEGAAAGGGFSLALACDLLVAADSARFSMAYTRVGLSPDGGSSWHLMQALPRALVLRLLWLAEPLTARELHLHGLAYQVCGDGEALQTALKLAERLAALPAQAVASIKELVNQYPTPGLRAQLDRERDQFVENLMGPDAGEGLQAFFDKREPRFG